MEREVKAFELRELWRRYQEGGDQSARERLVVACSPLAKFVAGRTGARLPRTSTRPTSKAVLRLRSRLKSTG
jgi:DNA-directed RNA polymerase specialized sigma subunit